MTSKKTQPQTPEAQLENLDQILSEIDDLQAEIQAETAPPAPVDEATTKPSHLQVVPSPTEETAGTAERAAEAALEGTETDILEEFRAGADERAGNLESTLADLSDEAPSGGGMLDQLLADEVSASLEREHLASLGETETETAIETVTESAPSTPALPKRRETETAMKDQNDEGSLTMTLKGNVTLKLQYEFEGQEVTVGFEGGFLKVVLADGTEFKVPVARARSARKAA